MRKLSTAAGIGVVLTCGLIHGLWTNRWLPAAEVEAGVARLGQVPKVIADWQGEDLELDARQRKGGGGSGYLLRRYTNQRTGEVMSVLLVCGHPGPVSVHTPDVCYQGAGFEVLGETADRKVEVGADPQAVDFKMSRVRKEGLVPTRLHVYWSWSAAGRWETPRRPRLAFAHHRCLFKLYVIHEVAGEGSDEPESSFIRLLMPQLQRALFANP